MKKGAEFTVQDVKFLCGSGEEQEGWKRSKSTIKEGGQYRQHV